MNLARYSVTLFSKALEHTVQGFVYFADESNDSYFSVHDREGVEMGMKLSPATPVEFIKL